MPRSQVGSRPTPGSVRSTSPLPPASRYLRELLEDDRLVARQLPVVPAPIDVPERDLGVLVRQREAERGGLDRAEDGLDVGHGQRCYAVAIGSGTVGRDGPAASISSRTAPARRSRSAGR